eukprot:COSAG02_NODE_6557_length_3497_cov_3.085344_2_plen_40_part_00
MALFICESSAYWWALLVPDTPSAPRRFTLKLGQLGVFLA